MRTCEVFMGDTDISMGTFCSTDAGHPMSTVFTNRVPGYYHAPSNSYETVTCQYCGSPWRIEMKQEGERVPHAIFHSMRCPACGGPLFDED